MNEEDFKVLCDLSKYIRTRIGADGVGCVLAFHCIFLEALVSTDCLISLHAFISKVAATVCEGYFIREFFSSVPARAFIGDAKKCFLKQSQICFLTTS